MYMGRMNERTGGTIKGQNVLSQSKLFFLKKNNKKEKKKKKARIQLQRSCKKIWTTQPQEKVQNLRSGLFLQQHRLSHLFSDSPVIITLSFN